MEFTVERLSADREIKPFISTDPDLNSYLFDDAKKALDDLSSVTYLLETKDKTIAYCSILNDRISKSDVSGTRWKKIKKKFNKVYTSYPSVKIGRLAVDESAAGHGIGTSIIDWLKVWFTDNNKTGCRFITVDAYSQSLKFYEKCGFIYFTGDDEKADTRQMYFDLKSIKEV